MIEKARAKGLLEKPSCSHKKNGICIACSEKKVQARIKKAVRKPKKGGGHV